MIWASPYLPAALQIQIEVYSPYSDGHAVNDTITAQCCRKAVVKFWNQVSSLHQLDIVRLNKQNGNHFECTSSQSEQIMTGIFELQLESIKN
jgi:hypothetical protein